MGSLRLRLSGADLSAVIPELEWQADRVAGAPVDLRLDAQDQDDLRWLWEDVSADLYAPGSGRRQRAEDAAGRIGEALGRAFASSEEAHRLLERALAAAEKPLVLIASDSDAVLALPWELARTPDRLNLASLAAGVARTRENAARPQVAPTPAERLRVLLVVSRPDAEEDVAYQAIAAKLLDRLDGRAEVTLVRPGTFPAFERMLERGPWDLVHYDGHGIAGQLAFEDGPVDAERIGRLLARAGVPVFALNACQSAVAGASRTRDESETSSVARALVDTGAMGVVAMGASVRVTSAITFFDRFYDEVSRGELLSVACQRARRAIEAGGGHGPLDWAIPVLYLREDLAPFRGRPSPKDSVQELDALLFGGETEEKAPRGVFVGRDGDLYVLDRAIDHAPRVLLFGAAGMGKTTLMEYLLRWRERTGGADRVFIFSFRHAPSLELLAQKLQAEVEAARPEAIQRFRSPQWTGTPLGDRLRGLAKVLAADTPRMRLFLFDNLETLAGYPEPGSGPYADEERAHFRRLLAALEGPGTRVVMTSRRDELELLEDTTRRFPLRGVRHHHRLEMLQEYAAVYAADRRLREAITDQRRAVVDELLQELGGHPLATRIAAYGLQDRPLEEVLASIRGQAARIEVPAAELGARSGSLEAAFAGALDALPAERRRALGILGLFAGRFHESDLLGLVMHKKFPDGVVGERSEAALRRVLAEARSVGLITPHDEIERVWEVVPGVQAMLESMWRREIDPTRAAAVEQHYIRYWASTAEGYRRALHEQGRARWALGFAMVDEGNLRKALEWAYQAREWGAARAILLLLLETWPMQGRLKEADHLRSRWLARVSDPGGGPLESLDRELGELWGALLLTLAQREAEQGRLEFAERLYHRIVEALKTAEDPQALAYAYHHLGLVEHDRGRLNEAEEWYRKSLAIEEELGDRPGIAASYHQLGGVEQERGRNVAAEEWYRKSLALKEERGDRRGMSTSYHQLGIVEQSRGRLDAAEEWYRKSLVSKEELRDLPGLATGYHQLGTVEQNRGQFDTAEEWYRKSLAIEEELGNQLGVAKSYHQLGRLEQARGRPGAAEEWYRKSLAIDAELGNRVGVATTSGQLGVFYLIHGEQKGGLIALLDALLIFTELGHREGARSLQNLRYLHDRLGREAFKTLWTEVEAPAELLDQVLHLFDQGNGP